MKLIAQRGIEGLTGSALAAEAGVSKATVFHHFPSMDQVPLAALDHIVVGLVDAVQHQASARDYLMQAGSDVLRLTAEQADEALAMNALLTGASRGSELRERMSALSTAYRDLMAEELVRLAPHADLDSARVVADIAIPAVDGLATHLMLTGDRERLDRAWARLVESLLPVLGERVCVEVEA